MIFQINSLLDIINNEIKQKKPTSDKENFLLELLKNIDNKDEIKDLIEKSNLSKEQKEDIFKKLSYFSSKKDSNPQITKNIPNKIPNMQNNSISTKNPISELPDFNFEFIKKDKKNNKTLQFKNDNKITLENVLNNKDNKNINDKNKTLFTQEELNILSSLKTQIDNVLKQEHELVKKIKTTIIKKSTQNSILKEIITTKEFKNATSFKDLINLSQKYDLNLVKIAISKKNTSKETSKNKIQEILNNKNIFINKNLNHNVLNKHIPKNKIYIDNLIQQTKKTSEIQETDKTSSLIKYQKEEIKPLKQEKKENENNFQFSSIPVNDLKQKIIKAKQSIKHFTNSLKEAIENYKPPVTKLSLELHPKELGKVEVTLKQRGDNLHVQINTNNQNAITFFTTQQQELKNTLVNMGFTNIDMNFNSNQEQKKEHQQQKKYKENNLSEEELVIDMNYKYA